MALTTKQTQKNLPKSRIISLSKARINKLYIFWQCMYIVYISDQVCQWHKGPSWLWSYGSCINNYLCNQCLLKLSVRAPFMARCTQHNIMWSSLRKPPIWQKSLTNCITQCCIEYTLPSAGFKLTTLSGDTHWLYRYL